MPEKERFLPSIKKSIYSFNKFNGTWESFLSSDYGKLVKESLPVRLEDFVNSASKALVNKLSLNLLSEISSEC